MSFLPRPTRRAAAVAGALLALSAGATPAMAGTTTLTFDALATGSSVGTLSGATFTADPTVFQPQHVTTQTPPKALHAGGPCAADTPRQPCGSQTITFANPASAVEMYVGMDDEAAGEIPTGAQLKAYNSAGAVVADTGDVEVGNSGYVAITKLFRVQSAATDITRVVLTVGSTDPYPNEPSKRVNIDSVSFTDDAQPPLDPPTVRLDTPAAGTTYVRGSDVRLSGRVIAPAGVSKFCLTVEATMPSPCNDRAVLDGVGNFRNLQISGLHPGANRVYAWVEDTQARAASAALDLTLSAFDLRPANMEVTQAVQGALPAVTPAAFSGPHTAAYNGVPLAARKATYVRVWTDAHFTGGPERVPEVRMMLSATRGGESLGAPIAPVNGLRALLPAEVTGSAITDALRSNPGSAYVFQLPPSWTDGEVSLTALVNPGGFPGVLSECEGCDGNNTLRLDGVRFTPMRTEVVTPVAEITRDAAGVASVLPPAPGAFAATAAVSPFPISVRPYQAVIDITAISNRANCDANCKNGAAFDQVSDFDQSTPSWNRQGHIVGINPGVARGLTAPVVFCCEPPRIDMLAITDAGRPLTSVAHEYYHQLGYRHAGANCPGDPGGFAGLFAEGWDPDNQGMVQAFGFDPRQSSGGAEGVFAIAGTQDAAGNPTQFFDLMSYCTNNYPETNSWISALNWTRAIQAHVAAESSSVRAAGDDGHSANADRAFTSASKRPTIAVTALQVGSAAPITRVETGLRGTVPAPQGKRDATVQLVDAGGDVVSKVTTVAQHGHVDQGPDVLSVGATVPDPGTAVSAQIKMGSKVLATVKRPSTKPKVKLLSPTRKTKVGSTGTVLVRWKVLKGKAKTTTIDFAADGRRFRPIALGLRGTSYKVPVELLAKGSKAKFRVRVNDGWNEAKASSRALKVAGPLPVAAVADVSGARELSVDGTLQLEGHAFGDLGRRLPAAALSWYHGRHLLGHGASVRVSGLPAGRQRIRLVARTRDGRRSSRAVTVRVLRRLR